MATIKIDSDQGPEEVHLLREEPPQDAATQVSRWKAEENVAMETERARRLAGYPSPMWLVAVLLAALACWEWWRS